ncbi:transcriptional regulator, SARP family protein [Deinococcus petrolearius]|uniref:Transcriptional regulator, SARP family protein n=1 Tax=Deinococcus petrolearius TaxID=1751295 RepID=A0ABW1DF11_9DEIO
MPHPLFREIQAGRFQRGLDLYAQIARPSPDDQRWAGYCLFSLGQLLPARDLLRRAQAQGCDAAGLELAMVLRHLGETEEAARQLAAVPLGRLAPLDRIYAQRERAAALLAAGPPRPAVEALEQAWAELLALGEAGTPLRPGVSQLLGYAHALLGRTARSAYYLEQALGETQGVRRVTPLHVRAQVHLYAGRLSLARQDLAAAQEWLGGLPGARGHHAYLQGLTDRAQGGWEEAATQFARGARLAEEGSDPTTEALCELGQAAVWTAQGQFARAGSHLGRAAHLPATPWLGALGALRRGAWHAAQGQAGAALPLLEEARQTFAALGTLREQAWADLHLGAALLAQAPDLARAALERAQQARHALGSGAALLPELRLLPVLGAFLTRLPAGDPLTVFLADRQAARCVTPLSLRLRTLGPGGLLVDGRPQRLGMRRTLELLAFLTLRGAQPRSAILNALWTDDDPRRATNYLHQCRKELAELVPGLEVRHDRASGLYAVHSADAPLSCDVLEIQRALSGAPEDEQVRAIHAYAGAFLPESGSAWVGEEREQLEWSVVRAGLELMARWSEAGEYEKCASLARRLLEVAPSDEGLVEYLVQATLQLQGRAAAQRTLHELALRAARELDELPAWHGRLHRTLLLN